LAYNSTLNTNSLYNAYQLTIKNAITSKYKNCQNTWLGGTDKLLITTEATKP